MSVGRSFSEFSGNAEIKKSLVSSQEEAANRTLANIIRQLGSLGLHANDIFGMNKKVSNSGLF